MSVPYQAKPLSDPCAPAMFNFFALQLLNAPKPIPLLT